MLFSTTGQAHAIVIDPKSSESQITKKIDALVDTGYDLNDPAPVTPFDSKVFTKWKEGAEVLNVEEIHPTVVYKTAVIDDPKWEYKNPCCPDTGPAAHVVNPG